LEFLGDAVLQLVLTEALFELFPADARACSASGRRNPVKGVFLTTLARELGLDACLRLGTSEETSGGRTRPAALEDGFEALVGALYLDSDLATVRRIVRALYGPLPAASPDRTKPHPKGQLQEFVQPRHGNTALRYEVTQVEGADHAREYEVAAFLHARPLGTGRGPSKKLAEEAAARIALETLKAELRN